MWGRGGLGDRLLGDDGRQGRVFGGPDGDGRDRWNLRVFDERVFLNILFDQDRRMS